MFGRVGKGCRTWSFGSKASSPQRTSRQAPNFNHRQFPQSEGSAGVRLLRLRETTTWRLGPPRHEASTLASIRAAQTVIRKGPENECAWSDKLIIRR